MQIAPGLSLSLSAAAVLLFVLGLSFVRDQQYRDEIDNLQEQVQDLMDVVVKSGSASNARLLTSSSSSGFTYAADYGVVGDAHTDDAAALQAAIDDAAANTSGGTVILPKGTFLVKSSIVVPAGITLRGQGYGSSPLAIQFDAGGSVIAYCGSNYAVKLDGHAASLQDLAVYDYPYQECESVQAAGGVLIDANSKGLESITMNNVLIYWFMQGASLTLRASNAGGIAYNNFQNLRIRHAHTGILLEADDTSFVNSNSFLAGAISGGITHAGILAQGPGACNDNKFMAMVIEPSETQLAHVYVTGPKTNVRLLDTRLEGTDMFALHKPLVIIDDSSYGNVMTGMLGHTHVQADLNRNPGIDLMSAKSVGLDPAPLNQYWNAAFKGFHDGKVPGWSLPANGVVTLSSEPPLYSEHNVLHIDYLNYGGAFKLKNDLTIPPSPAHAFATFGIYAKTSVPNAIVAAMRYESGSIISSSPHSGSGEWEFIGMAALYDKTAPYFYWSITHDVEVTAPVFTWGQTPATPGASLMSSSGARMAGTLSLGMATAVPPASGSFWVLPKTEGNIFKMDLQGNPSRTIHRINHRTADRFPRGSVVTLMFDEAGTTVAHSAYIKLKGSQSFTSTKHSALTLVANGDPTWNELSRNV